MPSSIPSTLRQNPARSVQKTAIQPGHAATGELEVAAPLLDQEQIQRAVERPTSMNSTDVLRLQRSIGNKAVHHLLNRHPALSASRAGAPPPPIQAKLEVGPVDDCYEREADRVAASVTNTSVSAIQPKIQRFKNEKPTLPLQPKRPNTLTDSFGGMDVQPEVEAGIAQARGGGQSIGNDVRSDMEQKFGADFSGVRIHNNSQADTLNRSLNARAFTTGQDIFFKSGEYQPDTQQGKKLLAHELTHVRQQSGNATAPVQRKSDKLPQKAVFEQQAKSNKFRSIFGATTYTKVLQAVDHYHNSTSNTDHLEQLQQLIKIHELLTKWQISHGETANTGGNKAADKRSSVLHSLRTNYLPEETADVYAQAKTANVNVDVGMLQQLLDIMEKSPGRRAQIETDYATALRTFTASDMQATTAMGIAGGVGSFLDSSIGFEQHSREFTNFQNMDIDVGNGYIDEQTQDAPISPHDSDTIKKVKQERRKLRGLKGAMQNMTPLEYMAIASYTDESGYREMNKALRGGAQVSGNSKTERQNYVNKRKQVQQLNLMGSSGLNRLPNWDGSPVYRGEDISWANGRIQNGADITLPSFTSTSANENTAVSMANGSESAVWEIQGVTHTGKDISKLTVQQKKDFLMGSSNSTEDEVLLKPYTKLRILSIVQTTNGEKYKWRITARQ